MSSPDHFRGIINETITTYRQGPRELGEIVYPKTPDIHIIRITNGYTPRQFYQDLLTVGQSNTTEIYHRRFSFGLTNNQVNRDLHEKNISTTFLAVMKPSESERIGLAGNLQLTTAKERTAVGIIPQLEFMEHLIPPGGTKRFFRELGVSVDEAGELGRFAITNGPKREEGDARTTFRDHKAQILQSLLDDAMIAAKEKGLKKVVLVRHPDLDDLFEEADRIPKHVPGSKLIPADPFNSVSKKTQRFYNRYPGYWDREDKSIPQIYVFDVEEYNTKIYTNKSNAE